ncbi:glycosyltransferase [Thiomicrorhabdus heinhorstiae]|uniref:Glycosyltransferase family 4 protein n=1 Tax=Thiomicrorhabdus heinhorstiae TaxID=2748010 RepID=A0ABS0BYH2_9GAMM|nr:glycosyltransferase [Thiomicrorhabdus heinhorstiae]MBF6058449.1 glycosyltransferase family 4 protein [Thiomicrorhabdus heinhorstiae]
MNPSTIHKILIIGHVWPEPNSSAAGSRMMQLIQQFLNADIVVTFATAAVDSPHAVDLQELGIHTARIELNDSSFDAFLKNLKPDAVLFDRFMIEEQFGWRVEKNCPDAVRILNTEDLHSLRHARHQLVKNADKTEYKLSHPKNHNPLEIQVLMGGDELTKREIAAIFRSDLSLMVSTFEMQLLQEYFQVPASQLYYMPLVYAPRNHNCRGFAERHHFISIGNFRHQPNWDAVLQLKQHIWPQLRRLTPNAELHIYGAYPPPKATALHSEKDGFLVKGWAQNAFESLEASRVLLAPLRFGAGIKGKLAEAMLCGTPSVTTPIGSEAMQLSTDWGGAVVENYASFIEAAAELYRNQQQWESAQQRGFKLFDRHFSQPHTAFENWIDKLNDYRSRLDEYRRRHFIGSLLNHHQHKSTQYMSQWIEAKNRVKDVI